MPAARSSVSRCDRTDEEMPPQAAWSSRKVIGPSRSSQITRIAHLLPRRSKSRMIG
jgi:hypothetical protein